MTAVGRRPTLDELILALHAIVRVEADADALDPAWDTFRVVLTFNRNRCPEDWREGQPKPTWLFEQLVEELLAWREQRRREELWVSTEAQFGASIDTVMAHWTEELKKTETLPLSLLTQVTRQILSNTILRLKELKERREVGGLQSRTENRREKARKAWMEDEYEAPKREEEQRRQREQNDAKYGWNPFGNGEFRSTHTGFTPQSKYGPDQRPWYDILGVPVTASASEIKKAHRFLTAKYHPDRYKGADGHTRMTEINTARDEGLAGL